MHSRAQSNRSPHTATVSCSWLSGTSIQKVWCVQLQVPANRIHTCVKSNLQAAHRWINKVLVEGWAKNPWKPRRKTFRWCVLVVDQYEKGSTRVGGNVNAAWRFCFDTLTSKWSDCKGSWRLACWGSTGENQPQLAALAVHRKASIFLLDETKIVQTCRCSLGKVLER